MGALERALGREAAYLLRGERGVRAALESCSQLDEQEQERSLMVYLSTNQKERAQECLAAKPPGGRARW